MLGLYIIFQVETNYTLGIVLALCSAFLAAIFTLINGKLIKHTAPSIISFYELLTGVVGIGFYLLYITFSSDGELGFNPDFFNVSLFWQKTKIHHIFNVKT